MSIRMKRWNISIGIPMTRIINMRTMSRLRWEPCIAIGIGMKR